MVSNNSQVKVGIGVLVFKDGKILLGKRKGSHGAGEYGGPGGRLEFGESIEDCIKREVKEEVGIEVKNIKFLCVSNIKKYKDKHYVDIGVTADWSLGEPKIMEPDKCEGWDWYDLKALPEPLFAAEYNYLEALKSGKNFFEDR